MVEWLINVLDGIPLNAHWTTRRRMAIISRWPMWRQIEAHHDAANGRLETLALMNAEIAEIKAAIPKA